MQWVGGQVVERGRGSRGDPGKLLQEESWGKGEAVKLSEVGFQSHSLGSWSGAEEGDGGGSKWQERGARGRWERGEHCQGAGGVLGGGETELCRGRRSHPDSPWRLTAAPAAAARAPGRTGRASRRPAAVGPRPPRSPWLEGRKEARPSSARRPGPGDLLPAGARLLGPHFRPGPASLPAPETVPGAQGPRLHARGRLSARPALGRGTGLVGGCRGVGIACLRCLILALRQLGLCHQTLESRNDPP